MSKTKKYIITESQGAKFRVLRRATHMDAMIPRAQKMVAKYYDICERGLNFFIDLVCDEVCEVMALDYFGDVEEDSQEWLDIATTIHHYIKSKHSDDITKYYKTWCPDPL